MIIPLVTKCTRACVVAFGYVCQPVFWVGLLHTPWVSIGILFWNFFLVGQLCLGQIVFGPFPHHPKIHHKDYIEGIPLNAKMRGALKACAGIIRVYSHCTSPKNSVQAGYNMEGDTQTNQCIPDARWTGICQKTEIPVPPWELVLSFLCAMSKWSRLIQTTLGCATCCALCDHPRWSCISRLTVHRWCWS